MAAEIQYYITFAQLGSDIFTHVKSIGGSKVSFTRQTGESRYSMEVDLSDILEGIMSRVDFEIIQHHRSNIDRYEIHDDIERANRERAELHSEYDAEQIQDFDDFSGVYTDYISTVGEKLLQNLKEYDLEDNQVLVETWL